MVTDNNTYPAFVLIPEDRSIEVYFEVARIRWLPNVPSPRRPWWLWWDCSSEFLEPFFRLSCNLIRSAAGFMKVNLVSLVPYSPRRHHEKLWLAMVIENP